MPAVETLAPAVTRALDTLTDHVLREACDRGLKLATAESCTGGLMASLLTDVPGRSHAFERGFVTYTDEAKCELLGVPSEVLKIHGAVSQAAAVAMAQGALARSRADVSFAVTGYAEAAPDAPQEAGLVWFATARRNGETIVRRERFGDIGRAAFRLQCLETGMGMIRDRLA
ncbi:MAG: cinA [Caulobacter sp.]|nr:cinA [Caulobacter sp.]